MSEIMYGYPVDCDPRDFTPDVECCTELEIARWKADCERAERGEPVERPTGCGFSPWGIGVQVLAARATEGEP